MPAYIIGRITVTDSKQYAEYMKVTPEIIARFSGRFIARGGEKVTLEGEPETARVVILEFPSMEYATQFFSSPEYQAAKALRAGAADAQFVAVDGYAP